MGARSPAARCRIAARWRWSSRSRCCSIRRVEANVRTGLSLRGVGREEQKRRIEEWLERFGIAHLRERSPRALSGGEAQRASLARAFALEPEVLLLDEPFASLDPPTRESLIEDLDAVLTANRVATVFVTHDRAEALRLGDRIAVLMQGRIRQLGSRGEVFASPMDEEVAAFVGVETIIPGRVRGVSGDLAAVDVGDTVIETASDLKAGSDVLVCLRPEDVVIGDGAAAAAPMSARNHLRATVSRVRSSGPYVRVELDAGFPLVALITKQSLEDLSLAPGASGGRHLQGDGGPPDPPPSALRGGFFVLRLVDRVVQVREQFEVVADDAVRAGGDQTSRLLRVVHCPAEEVDATVLNESRPLFVQEAVLDADPAHALVFADEPHELLPLVDSLDGVADFQVSGLAAHIV